MENDSIATSEIKYGDNDRLASRLHKFLVPIVLFYYRRRWIIF